MAKDKQRKQLSRSKMSTAAIEHERLKAKHRMWNLRQKRKRNAGRLTDDQNRTPEKITSPYSSRQAQGKAIKRVQYTLPPVQEKRFL